MFQYIYPLSFWNFVLSDFITYAKNGWNYLSEWVFLHGLIGVVTAHTDLSLEIVAPKSPQ